ncbi:MAG TPA: ABC transporter permease [Vicinamibacterales bacterium]|jgi:predicted permease
MASIGQDIRYALRALLRSPGFTAVAALSLALGIGATTAIFSLWYGVLLSPLPGVDKPEQLAILTNPNSAGLWRGRHISSVDGPRTWLTVEEFQDLRDHARSFSSVMASQSSLNTSPVGVDGGAAEDARWRLVSGEYFQTLGVQPALGRLFTAADDRSEAPYAVISHAYWQQRFGGRADVIGKALTIQRTTLSIVGVASRGFIGETTGERPDFWAPLLLQPKVMPGRDRRHDTPPEKSMWLHVFGRLTPGVTLAQAAIESNAIFHAGLESFYGAGTSRAQPDDFLDQQLGLQSGARGAAPSRKEFSQSLSVLLAAISVLLLITCANLASLVLARGSRRRTEIALRLSLGATRQGVIRQLMIESVLLAALGAVAAMPIAYAIHSGLVVMLAAAVPSFAMAFVVDLTLAAFVVLVTLVTGVFVGALPAWQISKLTPGLVLRTEPRGAIGLAGHVRSGRLLVAAQLALSLPLLVGAGLLVRTVYNLQRMDLGFASERLVLLRVDLRGAGANVTRTEVISKLLDSFRGTPGVRAITYSSLGLFQGGDSYDALEVEGFQPTHDRDRGARVDRVGPGYFSTLGIPIQQGRELLQSDVGASRAACVINQAFARQFFDQRAALGAHVTSVDDDRSRRSCEIVGVVQNARSQSLRDDVESRYFVAAESPAAPTFLIRTATETGPVIAALRTAVRQNDAAFVILEATSLDDQMAPLTAQDRATARLALLFGIVALALAAMGLYGVLSYAISARRDEIAVRIALGAVPGRVVSMILADATIVVVFGLLVGGALAYAGARLGEKLLASRLYGVAPQDPLTLALSIGVLLVVAFAASYIPAARASKTDPITALR